MRTDSQVLKALTPIGMTPTMTDQVSDDLRDAILSGNLKGHIKLSAVASGFDVSATPVREALRVLATEGLVKTQRSGRFLVSPVTRKDVEEIIAIRRLLEPMGIRKAMEAMTRSLVAQMEAVLLQMAIAETWVAWIRCHRKFHRLLYDSMSSTRFVALISSLQDSQIVFISAERDQQRSFPNCSTEVHGAIIEAVRALDVERLIATMLSHSHIGAGVSERE